MDISAARAIVTGGASGMGRCFAIELARAGGHVAVVDLDEQKMEEVVAVGSDLAGTIVAIRANVSDETDVTRLVDEAHERLGGLDTLVNNAGIFRDGLLVKPDKQTGAVKKMSLEQWNSVIAVDLTGPFLCTREFATKMITTGTKRSCIVNISSIARHGNVGQSNYSAAKAGLIADTRIWAVELARYGIRVGAIAPGFVDTPILRAMRPEVLEAAVAQVPLKRPATPEEVWLAVRFVLECDYFTGRCVDVDGGLSL
jgi:3-oxoacyl-[acyl-carrier protein] reductase